MLKFFGFATLGLLAFDVICIVVSIVLDYWIYLDTDTKHVHAGLWTICTETKAASNRTCTDVSDNSDYDTVRAMLILALLLVCGAIACIVVKLFVEKNKIITLYIAAAILFVAGLFLMVGFAVYHSTILDSAKAKYNDGVTVNAGFALCIIAWLYTWTAAGVTVLMFFITDLD